MQQRQELIGTENTLSITLCFAILEIIGLFGYWKKKKTLKRENGRSGGERKNSSGGIFLKKIALFYIIFISFQIQCKSVNKRNSSATSTLCVRLFLLLEPFT